MGEIKKFLVKKRRQCQDNWKVLGKVDVPKTRTVGALRFYEKKVPTIFKKLTSMKAERVRAFGDDYYPKYHIHSGGKIYVLLIDGDVNKSPWAELSVRE